MEVEDGTIISDKQIVNIKGGMTEERTVAGAVLKKYFGQGCVIQGAPMFFAKDHLGSVRSSVMGNGAQSQFEYAPYGERVILSGAEESDFGFAGLYQHSRSNFLVAGRRFYGPAMGRWLNRDPIGEIDGTSLFSYVGNCPLGFVDRSGLSRFTVLDTTTDGPVSTISRGASQMSNGSRPFTGNPKPIFYPDTRSMGQPEYNWPEYIGPVADPSVGRCIDDAFNRFRDCMKHPMKYPKPKCINMDPNSKAKEDQPNVDPTYAKCKRLYHEWVDDCTNRWLWLQGALFS